MTATRTLLSLVLLLASACDLTVGAGQTTTLGNRGWVIGVDTPNAVNVQPGGTLVVQDADLFGRGRRIAPNEPDTELGAAIVADGGTVRVLAGTIAGGNLLVDPNALPSPPTIEPRIGIGRTVDLLAPAIRASSSLVEIDGGTFLSSGSFGGPFDERLVLGVEAVAVSDSQLRIRGGLFGAASRSDDSRSISGGVLAQRSVVDISGGNFETSVVFLESSNARLRGGRFRVVILQTFTLLIDNLDTLSPSGCTEISGGAFTSINVSGRGERLIVLGNGFNLPLGRIALPPPTQQTFPSPFLGDPPIVIEVPTPFTLTGTLADGSPLAVRLDVRSTSEVVLAAPGGAECPAPFGFSTIGQPGALRPLR